MADEAEVVIKPGSVWTRKGTTTEVEIVDTTLKTKAPADANWHDAVEYVDAEDQGFVRTRDDFLAKYEPVADDAQPEMI